MNMKHFIDAEVMAGLSSAATKTSSAIDLTNSDGCLFVVNLSTKAQSAAGITASISGSTALAGTYKTYGPSQGLTGTTGATVNNRCLLLDLVKPLKPYAKVVVSGGSSGTMYLNNIVGIRYNLRNPGSTVLNDSTTVSSTMLISPTSS